MIELDRLFESVYWMMLFLCFAMIVLSSRSILMFDELMNTWVLMV